MAFAGTQTVNMRSLTGSWANGQGPDCVKARPKVRDEVRLEATASELHTLTFQRRLAEFSAKGVAVQVALVSQSSAPAPAPAPRPAVATAPAPWSFSNLGGDLSKSSQAMGMGLSMVGGLLGATGSVLLDQAIKMGPGPVAEMIAKQGLSGVMATVTNLDMLSVAAAVIAAGVTALGGALIGFKTGEDLRQLKSLKPQAQPAATPLKALHPKRVIESAVGGWLAMVATPGAAVGGFLGGHLLANALGAGLPVVMGVAGAALVGSMSLLGGWQAGKNVFK